MADTTLKLKKIKKLTKKQVTQEVLTRLSGALEEYKTKMGEKKFATKVKKASKLFATDLTKALRKDAKAIQKTKPVLHK